MGIFWEKKNKEDGKKSRFLLEIPNEGGRCATEFVRYFFKYSAAQLIWSKSHANLRTKAASWIVCP